MSEAEIIAGYLAAVRIRFGDDWQTRDIWHSSGDRTDRNGRIVGDGITLYIWRDRLVRAQAAEDAVE